MSPDAPDIPEAPDDSEVPDEPLVPCEPAALVGSVGAGAGAPDAPDEADAPDESEVPGALVAPDEADPPGVVVVSGAADVADESEADGEPEVLVAADESVAPEVPDAPELPAAPDDCPLLEAAAPVEGSCGVVWADPAAVPDAWADSEDVCAEGVDALSVASRSPHAETATAAIAITTGMKYFMIDSFPYRHHFSQKSHDHVSSFDLFAGGLSDHA